ncbi:hypothetical protein HKI87_09g60150 [Chloropicon roscoffensis]|uniref:F-box domain-containing protein n=1 Tax=Chloropicon roscoffensis TaxID=1461544 RepID=A0AAX4PFC4_9CHLO
MGTASSRGRDEMASGAAEPTAKRQKVDEADEEEDPLVRRREELVLGVANARAKGKELEERLVREAEEEAERLKREAAAEAERMVREAKERAILESDRNISQARLSMAQHLPSVCAALEAKNRKLLGKLPPELWQKIVDENVHQNDLFALAMTCRFFREKQKDLGRKVETDLSIYRLLNLQKGGKVVSHSLGWFRWVCDTFEFLPGFEWWDNSGALYEGRLLHYAAFQGSVEILRWLMEEKGCKLTLETGQWAGMGGSIEVLEYLLGKGYEFKEGARHGAAMGGHLEALKYLRGLDPPCTWDGMTCASAAWGGNLEALEFLRDQDPPCPWDEDTCAYAALAGRLEALKFARGLDPPCPWGETTCSYASQNGHLEVLKWARSQVPPCPWSKSHCSWEASENDHQHIVKWIDQQEDVSDVESSDSDSDRSYDSLGSEDF